MTTTTDSANQLVLRRVYAGAREDVFNAWTDRALLERWYTPGDGWQVSVTELDVRVGGRYCVLFGPPGASPYEESGEYLEIVPPARLAFTTVLRHEGELIAETRCQVDFVDLAGQTEVVLTEDGVASEDMEDRARGWGETLDHLYAVFA